MRCRHLRPAFAEVFSHLQRFMLPLVLPLAFLPIDGARAGTTVRVVETWPPGNYVTLGRNENFYLRLEYETEKPVHIWARPYFNGKPANVGSNPSQKFSGKGEAFGWFFFSPRGGVVDEVRIMVGDGSASNTSVVAVWRGDIVGGSEVDRRQSQPAWIAEMGARAKAAQDEVYRVCECRSPLVARIQFLLPDSSWARSRRDS